MPDLAQAQKAPPQTVAAKRPFTSQRFRRAAVWGVSAAGALLVAVIAGRSGVGVERLAVVLHRGPTQLATRAFDAQAETQRLAEAVRGLTANDEQIKSRLAAVEHDVDDITGSISKQVEAANKARRSEGGPSVAATATVTAAMIAAAAPPPTVVASAPAAMQSSADAAAAAAGAAAVSPRTAYGVDIGSGLTIQALRARWEAIRSAHPQLFAGLQPIVSIKEVPRANRIELRLVAGPFADAGAAAQFCAALTPFGLFCQPTMFDGQRLALR
jgi:hypothetical protein